MGIEEWRQTESGSKRDCSAIRRRMELNYYKTVESNVSLFAIRPCPKTTHFSLRQNNFLLL